MLPEPQIKQDKNRPPFKCLLFDLQEELDEGPFYISLDKLFSGFPAEIDSLIQKHFPGFPREKVTIGFTAIPGGQGVSRHMHLILMAEGFTD